MNFKIESILEGLLAITIAFIAPIQSILVLMGCLLISDLITGIIKARKKGEEIRSGRLFDTAIKMLIYTLLIILTRGFEETFSLQFAHVTHIASLLMCYIELKSNYENGSEILGMDLLKYLMKALKGIKSIDSNSDHTGDTKRH